MGGDHYTAGRQARAVSGSLSAVAGRAGFGPAAGGIQSGHNIGGARIPPLSAVRREQLRQPNSRRWLPVTGQSRKVGSLRGLTSGKAGVARLH